MSLIVIILIVLIICGVGWGGYSTYGPSPRGHVAGWSPLIGLLILLLVLKVLGVV